MQKWKTLSSKLAFDHRWFKVQQDTVELPNGKVYDDYFMWPEGDVVFAIPVTTDNKLVLVKQYKHAAGEVLIEFPAGYLNSEETPEEGARRELLEETGYDYKRLTKLFVSYNNPTKIRGKYYFFLAEEAFKLEKNPHSQDETENIEVLVKSPEEVYEMLLTNEIKATSSIAAGFFVLQRMGTIK
jgi:ADP-ribose pyrophosphatase